MNRATLRRYASRCVLAVAFLVVPASSLAVAVIAVSDPWVRLAPNGKSAEAFMEIRSSEGGAIVGVESDIAADIAMQRPGSRRVVADKIPLPPGTSVKLAPGAYRFLLPKLDRSLKLGDRVAFHLIVEAADGRRQAIPVNAEVRRRSAYDDHLHPPAHAH